MIIYKFNSLLKCCLGFKLNFSMLEKNFNDYQVIKKKKIKFHKYFFQLNNR
jgi:hypothetical protein